MNVTSRRHILTTAAALAGATAVNVGAIAKADGNDAELLALGEELERYIVKWKAQVHLDDGRRAAWEAGCEAAGLPKLDFDEVSGEEWVARNEARSKIGHEIPDDAIDEHGCSIVWGQLHDEQWPLIDKILAFRPRTLAGLAVSARAMSLSVEEIWDVDEPSSLDEHVCCFVEAVCGAAGVEPVRNLRRHLAARS